MMARPRWYPSNVTLPDSHVLVLSGSENPTPFVEEVERYDVASNRFSTLGPTASWTARFLYPRLFLLADGTVARVGMERQTRYLDPVTETWSNGPSLNYGDRENGTMIRLAGNRVLPVGGSHGGLPTSSTEIIDFDDPTPAWTYSRRDGRTAAASERRTAARRPRALGGPDPRHPDDDGRGLSPPYLFAGPRPVIDGAPSGIGYGGTFAVATTDADQVDEVTLVRAGSVTHGVNFDRRTLVQSFARRTGALTVQEPASGIDAPPGWYMMFLLDHGVPSVAVWVQVGSP